MKLEHFLHYHFTATEYWSRPLYRLSERIQFKTIVNHEKDYESISERQLVKKYKQRANQSNSGPKTTTR